MVKPLFSVIIPTFNEEKFLPHLLDSLTKQTNKNFEVIVVDGSSNDKTVEVAKKFKSKLPGLRIKVSKVASLPLQRNFGAGFAKSDWFVFADADSVLLPHFIERIKAFIKEEKPFLFTTWFTPDSKIPGDAIVTLLNNSMIEGSIILKRPFSPGPLTVVSRRVFENIRGYDETRSFGEDQDFSARAAEYGTSFHVLRETLCVLSLRRFRKEGRLHVLQTYGRAILSVLLTKKPPKYVKGYIMGGHLYARKSRPVKRTVIRTFETRLKRLVREVFE